MLKRVVVLVAFFLSQAVKSKSLMQTKGSSVEIVKLNYYFGMNFKF